MRVLAIDFGERRVGLAIGESVNAVATPYDTLLRTSDRQLLVRLAEITREEEIAALVLGEPLGLDGRPGAAADRVRGFARKLAAALALPLELVPETLTSREAETRLLDAGVSPRRLHERVDAVAAQILLEEVFARTARGTRGTA